MQGFSSDSDAASRSSDSSGEDCDAVLKNKDIVGSFIQHKSDVYVGPEEAESKGVYDAVRSVAARGVKRKRQSTPVVKPHPSPYIGFAPTPLQQPAQMNLWWLPADSALLDQNCRLSKAAALQIEIQSLLRFDTPGADEVADARACASAAAESLKKVDPSCGAAVVGSLAHGLVSGSSLDEKGVDVAAVGAAEDLRRGLIADGWLFHSSAQSWRGSGEPTILLSAKKFNTQVRIHCCRNQSEVAEYTAAAQSIGAVRELWGVRFDAIVTVFRFILRERHLLDRPKRIPSHVCLLVAAAFLRSLHTTAARPEGKPALQLSRGGLASILVHFLHFVGYQWDYLRTGLAVHAPGGAFRKGGETGVTEIADPGSTLNAGWEVRCWGAIKHLCATSLDLLSLEAVQTERPTPLSRLLRSHVPPICNSAAGS
eukprot:TRINITY_DN17342_c0_g1_i1.p1 TRINITY_DN17342_c0_g1~~TRINITY_DN17342_c0_g1_i1.p1  ORF type:complete len:451 (+),score=88.14 TRINITY_DN17342_c0_g1_i1:78-1355(+)